MSVETTQRIAFLNRIHLFHGLDDEQIAVVVGKLDEKTYSAGQVVFKEREPADRFFLIYRGKISITRIRKGHEQQIATFVAGDFFGEEALITHRPRSATVSATEETLLLVLSRADFNKLLKQVPQLKPNVAVAIDSRRLARRLRYKWLREAEGEVIYFLARKHPILLLRALILPAIAIAGDILLLTLTWGMTNNIFAGLGRIALFFFGLWVIWEWIDWGNDYFIVTNQRVLLLEKVIGIYDDTKEAPLRAVQSVNVTTSVLGRLMGYGDVILRTYVEHLTFYHISHPYQAASLVEEHKARAKVVSSKEEVEIMKQALRDRLLSGQQSPVFSVPFSSQPTQPKSPYHGLRRIGDIFKLRLEVGETITYRKHLFVLFRQTWKPLFLSLGLIVLLGIILPAVALNNPITILERETSLVFWSLAFIGSLGWLVYEYIDWSNDIFQVTADQILDIDKKPLGSVARKTAPLDNILGIEYKRRGILELLFNYGTVYITIGGGEPMAFEDVRDPASVQQDIVRRQHASRAKKDEEGIAVQRERMVDWVIASYQSRGEFQHQEEPPKSDQNGVK